PLAQCVPILMGLSNTGSWPVQTPFCTSAQMAQPTEQNGQIVLTRLITEASSRSARAGACAVTRLLESIATAERPPTPVNPELAKKRRRESPFPSSELCETCLNAVKFAVDRVARLHSMKRLLSLGAAFSPMHDQSKTGSKPASLVKRPHVF